MPRFSPGTLPKYRKHRASGNAIVTLNGRDHYLGPHGSKASRLEYDRLIREHVVTGGASPDKRDELTIVELCAAFLAHAKDHYSDESQEVNVFRSLVKRLRMAYGKTLVKDFGPLKLKAFPPTLIDEQLSRTMINHCINRVRRIVKWGVGNELVRSECLDALRAVDGLHYGAKAVKETEPVQPVPDAHVDAVLPYCSPQVASMIALQRVAGMRSGEVCRMTTAAINTQGSVWTYIPEKHKTKYRGHSRVVYLGPRAQAILREWLRTELEAPLFQPAEAERWRREQQHAKRKTPLSCGNRPGTNRKSKPRRSPGREFTPSSYGRAIKYAIMRCNRQRTRNDLPEVPSWHSHQLRHSAATLYRKEHSLEVASVLLGHKHVKITEGYAKPDVDRAVAVIAKIG